MAYKAELNHYEGCLQQLRVSELHLLLSTFKHSKIGKKSDLLQRCLNLLYNSRNQTAVMQKIREITAHRHVAMRPGNSMNYDTRELLTVHRNEPSVASIRAENFSFVPQLSTNQLTNNSAINMTRNSNLSNVYGQINGKYLQVVDLPFYDKLQTVLDLTELPASSTKCKSVTPSRLVLDFAITPDLISQVTFKSDLPPTTKVEVQLRFFPLDFSKEQNDDFPPNCVVKLNDENVILPNLIPSNKPGIEAKRPSRPVNITPYCMSRKETIRCCRLNIEWTSDERAWAVGVYLVNRVDSDVLKKRLLSNMNAHRSRIYTKNLIECRITGNDDEGIQIETLRLSLLCPIGKIRMEIPTKSYDCKHLQCFDLSMFLKMNEKRPTWKCPVCNANAHFKKLIIDGYFENILKDASPNIMEIELLSDGTWRVVEEDLPEKEMDYNEVSSVPTFPNRNTKQAVFNGPGSQDDDIIILSDSDGDESDDGIINQVQVERKENSRFRAGADKSVIVLDESDASSDYTPPRLVPEPQPQIQTHQALSYSSNFNHNVVGEIIPTLPQMMQLPTNSVNLVNYPCSSSAAIPPRVQQTSFMHESTNAWLTSVTSTSLNDCNRLFLKNQPYALNFLQDNFGSQMITQELNRYMSSSEYPPKNLGQTFHRYP